MDTIGSISQNKGSFVVNKDLELVGEEEEVELIEKNFEATRETEDSNKWDGTYKANNTAWN